VVGLVDVFIKNVDKEAYKLAKMLAAREEKKIGEVISESVFLLAGQKKKKGFAALKPTDFGPGTEHLSTQIDEILYGE